jgi:hypothetical protein
MEKENKYPKKVYWDNFKFRCSSLGKIMTNDRSGKSIGQTAISYLEEIYLEQVWGFKRDIKTKYMEKGNQCEQDGVSLVYDLVYGRDKFLYQNTTNYQNDHITGTPDIVNKADDIVHDIKISWDIYTFLKAQMTKDYDYQLRGYMWLLGFDKAELDYCLVNTPEQMIEDEYKNLAYYGGYIDDQNDEYLEKCNQIELNMTYDRIPKENRLKRIPLERDTSIEDKIIERVLECREILKNMSL